MSVKLLSFFEEKNKEFDFGDCMLYNRIVCKCARINLYQGGRIMRKLGLIAAYGRHNEKFCLNFVATLCKNSYQGARRQQTGVRREYRSKNSEYFGWLASYSVFWLLTPDFFVRTRKDIRPAVVM